VSNANVRSWDKPKNHTLKMNAKKLSSHVQVKHVVVSLKEKILNITRPNVWINSFLVKTVLPNSSGQIKDLTVALKIWRLKFKILVTKWLTRIVNLSLCRIWLQSFSRRQMKLKLSKSLVSREKRIKKLKWKPDLNLNDINSREEWL